MKPTRPHLHIAASGKPARPAGQMSLPNAFDGRGRSRQAVRRVSRPRLDVSKAESIDFWAALVARRCGSREVCAVTFGVTFQTACNWFDGITRPTFDKALMALAMWPADFATFTGGAR